MRKRSRLHVRLPQSDSELIRAAAAKLDISVSELVRRAVIDAAVTALRERAAGTEGLR